MKKLFTIFAVVLLTATVWAQSPEKMSYQAVIRNSSDILVTNTQIGMQISILQGSASGTVVYVEIQTPTSNANGLVSLEIGTGTTSDDFSSIDWANGPYFIKTETDPAGGTSYSITGTSQLLSVPYALYAKNTESWMVDGDTVSSTKRVGIGTSIPTTPLEVYGDGSGGNAGGITINRPNGNPFLRLISANGETARISSYSTTNGGGITFITKQEDGTITTEKMRIADTGNVGIGTSTPVSKVSVAGGDINILDIGSGVIMKSPDGNCWRITVDNNGSFVSTAISCP